MDYQDFDLRIGRTQGGFLAEVLNAPAGPASVPFTLPFSDDQIENVLLRLGRTRAKVRRIESSPMRTAKAFGAALFDAVFTGPVRDSFVASVDRARASGHGLRIRVSLTDPDLTDLPWEYLYNRALNRFLALSLHTPLVRYMDLPGAVGPITVAGPLRVLVMISSPSDYPALDTAAEWARLTGSLADLMSSGRVAVDRLDDASLPALQRCLRRSKYHIFHFIGHGEFDQDLQEGMLLLQDEQQRGHRVSSQYLGMLLHDHESLRVAILNACEGARSSRHDPYAGSAQTLVQGGIPAVIAMQFEVADHVASTFAHEFYAALADGYPIDAAVTEARKAIFSTGHDVEWGTPVLYLRAPDGRIFDIEQAACPSASTAGELPGATSELTLTRLRASVLSDSARAMALVRAADVALAHGNYQEALERLRAAGALDPAAPRLGEFSEMAEQQRAVAETRARRRQAVHGHVRAAATMLGQGNLAGAAQRVREALKVQPSDQDALALLSRIRQARVDQ